MRLYSIFRFLFKIQFLIRDFSWDFVFYPRPCLLFETSFCIHNFVSVSYSRPCFNLVSYLRCCLLFDTLFHIYYSRLCFIITIRYSVFYSLFVTLFPISRLCFLFEILFLIRGFIWDFVSYSRFSPYSILCLKISFLIRDLVWDLVFYLRLVSYLRFRFLFANLFLLRLVLYIWDFARPCFLFIIWYFVRDLFSSCYSRLCFYLRFCFLFEIVLPNQDLVSYLRFASKVSLVVS